jgi:hypothetical protein
MTARPSQDADRSVQRDGASPLCVMLRFDADAPRTLRESFRRRGAIVIEHDNPLEAMAELCAWASQESGAAGSRAILLLLDPPAEGDAHALVAAVERHLPGTVVAAYRAADPSTIRAVRSSDLIGDEGHARDDEEPQPLTPVVVPRSAEELAPMMSRRASMTSATGPVLRLTPPLDDDPDETVRTSAASSADQLTREELAMLLDSDPACDPEQDAVEDDREETKGT